MGISDRIEAFIAELLKNDDDVRLGRNELASLFQCVPSQINYVISTRFSPERGYAVESRRGGGGYIRIRRIGADDILLSAITQIGDTIDYPSAESLIEYLYSGGAIDALSAKLILSSISEKSLDAEHKNKLRANILKNTLGTYGAYKEKTQRRE